MPTVAELLNPAATTTPSGPTASDSGPAPPPGFVPANDQAPAPPPEFVPAGAKQGSGLLANLAQGASEGVQFNGGLIRDALINPRAITDRIVGMVGQVMGDKPAPSAPGLGAIASIPADMAARKASNAVVAATPAERIVRSAGAGATGAVLNPEGTVAQMLSGAAGGLGAGVASEMVPENLKPVAALVGGVAGYGLAHQSVAAKFGPKVADVVAEAPRDVVLTPEGKLTEDGKEIAAQNGLHPDQVKAAYDHFDEVKANTANDNPDLPPVEAPAMAVGDGLTRPTAEEPPTNTTAQEAIPAAEASTAQPIPEAPSSAAQRLAEAKSEGIDLTRGEAMQDFAAQEAENTLLNTHGTPESAEARIFKQKQQAQIGEAVDRFRNAFGNPEATAEDRGAQIQEALQTLRDSGKKGATAFYEAAREAAEKIGPEASNLLKLDTGGILGKLRELFIDEGVPDQVRKALKQYAAKYGLIGEDPTTVEGETTVKLRDDAGNLVAGPRFIGPVEPLTINNAEAFRQKINSQFKADDSSLSQQIKPLIDDAVQKALARAASEGPAEVARNAKAGREAYREYAQTFKAKDIVQSLVDWKSGTKTPQVSPDKVLNKILGNDPDSITSTKRIKAVLLNKPTDKSPAAWTAVQAHAIGKIFDKAQVLNASADGPVFSGAKLHSAIQAFGPAKLKIILGEEDFNQLMKLNRIMRNATVPIKGTTNPSGSAYTLISFLGKQGMKLEALSHFVPVAGPIARAAVGVVAHGVKGGLQDIKAAKTLKGIREYDLTQAANEDAKAPKVNAAEFVSRFIQATRDPAIVAPILAASATQSTKDAGQ
jgi:hypothetical protein